MNPNMLRGPNVNTQLDLMKKMLNDYKNDIINTINSKGESNEIIKLEDIMRIKK